MVPSEEEAMKALVFHGIGDVRLDEVREPRLIDATDAIVRLTASAICGTDLHMVRGTLPDMRPGTILGHEGVGVIEDLGEDVRNLVVGDRVVVCSTIACGSCVYCRAGYHSQCDRANPNGPEAGTAFFGGPASSGPFPGLQAEKARIPYAHVGCVKLPDEVSDEQAILLSDIFPTGYFAAQLAEIRPGDTVAVFGCGPVGQFAIASARLLGAGRVLAIDTIDSRLELARAQGAEVVDYDVEEPVATIKKLTGGIGVDRAIDAVGVDANAAHAGPALRRARKEPKPVARDLEAIVSDGKARPDGDNWHPGDAPSQALFWAVEALAKGGTLSIVGVYPDGSTTFPIGAAMNKNLTIKMGNCNHRRYVPELIEMVRTGRIDPARILSHRRAVGDAVEAYKAFDRREEGWTKVELTPSGDDAQELSASPLP
jgi:threonine dehydrogenase-like Zn-dependent dehydrogenase